MSIAERYLSYTVPPVISSSEFTTEYIEYAPSGSKRDFIAGDAFTISLANLNKAQYLLPDSCSLTFDVVVSTTAAPAQVCEFNGVYQTLDRVPRILWGCPFFESTTVSVPGSADFNASPSSAEQTAAYWYSTRLLASSTTAQHPHDRGGTFRLGGRYNMAGGKSGFERAEAITGAGLFKDGGGVNKPLGVRGNALSYSVPLSAFCTLFCKSSSLIPIGMLSSGGEALVFNFTVSRDAAAVLGFDTTSLSTELKSAFNNNPIFTILNPRIVCSVVRVQNPVTVAQLSSLYDARVKMALPAPEGAKPVEMTVPMVIAHKRFLWARTLIPAVPTPVLNASSPLALTFSGVNEPSVSAIVLRFRYRPQGSLASRLRRSTSSVYLGSDEPPIVIRDLQVRLNDQLIPLRGISDQGVSTVAVTDAAGGTILPGNANGNYLVARTSSGVASQLFELGRHGLGLYMEDDHCTSLSDVVFDKDISFASVVLTSTPLPDPLPAGLYEGSIVTKGTSAGNGSMTEMSPNSVVSSYKSPIGLFVIPLTSFPQLVGDFSNAHTWRSWDLRSVSSFSVTGSVQVVDTGIPTREPGIGVPPGLTRGSFVSAPAEDVIVDGALVCDGALRLAAGSSDSRYQYSMISSATTATV